MGISERLAAVDEGIADAARAANRDPGGITRIVVTKFHPASVVDELYGLGVRDIGENRSQELSAKSAEVGDRDGLRWHFVGQAQTNKARAVRAAASVVHSVDRARIADALDAAGGETDAALDVLLQVNLTDDPDRGGVAESNVEALATHVLGRGSLRLRGVMAVAPVDDDPAAAFERLARAAAVVRSVAPDATWLSAGMSGDYREAIAAGATHLRIGTAITGPRPVHP